MRQYTVSFGRKEGKKDKRKKDVIVTNEKKRAGNEMRAPIQLHFEIHSKIIK